MSEPRTIVAAPVTLRVLPPDPEPPGGNLVALLADQARGLWLTAHDERRDPEARDRARWQARLLDATLLYIDERDRALSARVHELAVLRARIEAAARGT